ncbi:MAG: hypothetical protein DI634_10970, partial [Kocuria palustris]
MSGGVAPRAPEGDPADAEGAGPTGAAPPTPRPPPKGRPPILFPLFASAETLPGIGPRAAEALA